MVTKSLLSKVQKIIQNMKIIVLLLYKNMFLETASSNKYKENSLNWVFNI